MTDEELMEAWKGGKLMVAGSADDTWGTWDNPVSESYQPADLSGLTLDEAKEILNRIHRTAAHLNCTRPYTPEDICELGDHIVQIIERFET